MRMNKLLVLGAAGILISGLFVMPVSAHGHQGHRTDCAAVQDYLCEVCTEKDCEKKGWHIHDGSTYCGYDHEDGYCDGSCDTARVCTEEQCKETGHHIHDGTIYCGYDHSGGYCDRSCEVTESAGVRGRGRHGRHHGCH